MKIYKKSEIGRDTILAIIILLAVLIVMLLIIDQSREVMIGYFRIIFS